MKTLDEVIKAWSICFSDNSRSDCTGCPYADEDGDAACFNHDREDALHYLKEYKANRDDPDGDHQQLEKCRALLQDFYRNDPLSWDELKQMEGKPVWVEILSDEIDLSSRWMMVARETKAHSLPLAYTDDMGHWIYGHEDDLGKTWQAYRKERG